MTAAAEASAGAGRCAAIVVNFHCAASCVVAVQGILEQDAGCAVWVVDNSACDAEAAQLAARLPAGARLLVPGRNIGFGAACNLAWREITAEHVLLLNPDARLLPGALAKLVAALDEDRALAAVAPATWWDDARRWLLPTLLPETARMRFERALARSFPRSIGQPLARRWLARQQRLHAGAGPQPVDWLSGAVLLLRRTAVEEAGGLFDEAFFLFFEDADLCRRLAVRGYRLALVPRAHAVHRWRNRAGKSERMAESEARYLAKHYPGLARLARGLGLACADPFALLGARVKPTARGWGICADRSPAFVSAADCAAWLDGAALVCLSPSPWGYPAAFRPAGEQAQALDEALWNALDPGCYAALARRKGSLVWVAFEKAAA